MFKQLCLAGSIAAVASGAHAATTIGDVFYIAMENHNWTQPSTTTDINPLFGNSAAPFINSLVTPGNPNAAMVSYASNYVNVTPTLHPSEPNYVWMEAGKAGPLNDANPFPSNIVSPPDLSGVLQSRGISWKSYQEDTDLLNTGGQNFNAAGGTLTNNVAAPGQYEVPLKSFSGTSASYTNDYNGSHQYNFAAKHDGQLFFTDTNGGNDPTAGNVEASHYAPLQQLAGDLSTNSAGRYNWITPDQYNDMHSALSTDFTYDGVTYSAGTDEEMIALGDNFLSKIVPMIEASTAFKNNGEIVIWNDETEGPGATTSMEIVISPLARGNAYTNTIRYTHTNDLATLQQIFGVLDTPLGAAAGAYTMADLYKSGALGPPVPEPATWALMITGFVGAGAMLRRRNAGTAFAHA